MLLSYGAGAACSALRRKWGSAKPTLPFPPPCDYQSTHPLRRNRPFGVERNHPFGVYAPARLGTTIRAIVKPGAPHTPSEDQRTGFSIRTGPALCGRYQPSIRSGLRPHGVFARVPSLELGPRRRRGEMSRHGARGEIPRPEEAPRLQAQAGRRRQEAPGGRPRGAPGDDVAPKARVPAADLWGFGERLHGLADAQAPGMDPKKDRSARANATSS